MVLSTNKKSEVIEKFAQAKGDTGSPEVQIALLTQEITVLQEHLKEHKHDVPAKRAVLSKVAKRRRLLRYLSSRSADRYQSVSKALKLKK
ncbi:MAG: 30S ribosomal protein S15 [Patescibacteria group bacterium]